MQYGSNAQFGHSNGLGKALEQSGQIRYRCQPPRAPRSSWGSSVDLLLLGSLCLLFMAAAA